MPRRFPWRSGQWLVTDEESGLVRYSNEITRDYYGKLITKRYADPPHPQEFVMPIEDGIAPPFTSVQPEFVVVDSITVENAPPLNQLFMITDENGNILETESTL